MGLSRQFFALNQVSHWPKPLERGPFVIVSPNLSQALIAIGES